MSDRELLRAALPTLATEALAALEETLDERRLAAGEVLLREATVEDTLFLIAEGCLALTVGTPPVPLAERGPGAVLGELALLTGRPRSATATALEPTRALTLSREAFVELVEAHPSIQDALIRSAEDRASDDALTIGLQRMLGADATDSLDALRARAERVRYARGAVVCSAGDLADGCYVVLHGELVVLIEGADGPTVVRSMGSGETLGELALLLDGPRTATVVARRDTQLAHIHRADFDATVRTDPVALLALSRRLAGWLATPSSGADDRHRVVLLRPVSDAPQGREFADALRTELARFGPATLLDGRSARGRGLTEGAGDLLDRIIDAMRREHSFTLLLADPEDNAWTARAEGAADLVLVLTTDEDAPRAMPAPSEERAWKQERWLVRLHPADRELPTPSAPWIEAVEPDLHLNARVGDASHAARVARLVAGRAVGIALSGGAARGFGHFGTVLALEDFGIPVDCISGSSAGSLAAVLIAQGGDLEARAGDRVAQLMAEGNPFADVTLPVVAVLRSERIKRGLQRVFGDQQVEDLWLPVRVAVTDLGRGELRSYDRGTAWQLTLASGSPPGLTVPVVVDGRVCCDAGVLDNLPVSLLPKPCSARLASMVGGIPDLKAPEDGFPGPWSMLWGGMFGGKKAKAPNIGRILLASTVIGSNHTARQSAGDADLFFEPELRGFGSLDFSAWRGMLDTAREHARAVLEASPEAAAIRERARGAAGKPSA